MTELKTWLAQERGRAVALAAYLGVGKARVSQIAAEGVPKHFMLKVRDFTKGEVTLEAMLNPVQSPVDEANAAGS